MIVSQNLTRKTESALRIYTRRDLMQGIFYVGDREGEAQPGGSEVTRGEQEAPVPSRLERHRRRM